MPGLKLKRFAGLRPRVAPHLLPDEYAQVAHNARLMDGTLQGWRTPRKVLDTQSPATIFKVPDVNDTCGPLLTFDHCVSIIDTPAPGLFADLDHFVVFHHNGDEPQRYFPARDLWAPLVVPAPTTRLTPTRVTATSMDTEPYRGPDQTTWTYTWVDQFGVESPPAPPSVPVRRWDDEVWELRGFSTPPANAEYMRIYRAMPSFDDGEQVRNPFDTSLQLLAEIEVGAMTDPFTDDVRNVDMELGTLLTEWDQPPEDMQQVVGTELGYLVGFRGNDIFVSERYEPHHWPEKYRMNVPDRIVALVSQGEWVYVMTTGHPYRVRPEPKIDQDDTDVRLDLLRYPQNWPAMGRFACCQAPFGALYVTRRGLVALTPDRATMVTSQRINVDEWFADWAPNLIAWHDGKLFAWRSGTDKGYVLDMPESGDALDPGDLVTMDLAADMVHVGRDGWLYIGNADGVHVWGEGFSTMPWRWRSKVFELPSPLRFSAAKVHCRGTVMLYLYADGELVFTSPMEHNRPVRIPPYPRATQYEIELRGDAATMLGVHLSTSLAELSEG